MKARPIRIDGDVAYITLTKGYTAVIDAADVPLVDGYNWCALVRKPNNIYAKRNAKKGEECLRCVYLHRAIMGDIGVLDVDHIDGDGLNNRRSNLRLATRAQNIHNSRPYKGGSSKYKGVSLYKATGKWQTRIKYGEKQVWLGYHATEEQAYAAYCEASARLHGEFGRVE